MEEQKKFNLQSRGRKNDALTSINLRLKIKANSTNGHSAIKGQVLRQRW